jgi:lysophospholipase L1-like esterase
MTALRRLFTLTLLLATTATPIVLPAQEADRFALPKSEEGLPGEGNLRRYNGYVRTWATRRAVWSKQVSQDQQAVVFLGDSITQGWGAQFRGKFTGMKLANRGIGGDTTRGMLIRLQEDVLSLNPSAIVLLMGTNDLEVGLEPELIGRNFTKIIAGIKSHSKTTPIILCRVFPSSASKKRPADKIQQVNAIYEVAVKGDPQVTVVDTWTLYATAKGDANPKLFPDLLHLNAEGYKTWGSALRPIFATLGFLETKPTPFTPDAGFTSLFNGKDLTGWGFRVTPPRKKPRKPRPNAPVFVEIKEAISFDGKTRSNDQRYAAIHGKLVVTTPAEGRRIQQLWTTAEFGGNFILKLQFRATPNADSGVFIRKPQLQCRDYLLAGPYKDLKKYRPQEWNDLVVTVTNGIAHATCNGELLTDKMAVPASGPIGLEGDRGQVEYRHLQLKQLP